MQRNDARAALGGLVVTGVFLGVIVTMEPASRLVRLPFDTGAVSASGRYRLLPGLGAFPAGIDRARRRGAHPRVPSPSMELE